jgi:effector-binding domain-containing protein
MMIGKVFLQQSFESGLSSLKEYMEANPPSKSSLGPISIETQKAMLALVAGGSGPMSQISQDLGRMYGLVMTEVQIQGLEMAGMPFAHYLTFDESTGESSYKAGVEVNGPASESGEVKRVSYPEMEVVRAIHTGSYEELSLSYEKIQQYIDANGLETNGEVFELYLTDPGMEPDQSKWQTLISFPLK